MSPLIRRYGRKFMGRRRSWEHRSERLWQINIQGVDVLGADIP